jgi:hydroxymethylglutaryl-CoA lyase
MPLPASVSIVEVGPRDGLQLEPTFIDTAVKIELVNRIAEAGVGRIEVTSFVSPMAIPQMRDADAVMRGIARRPGCVYSALVPNRRGAERALAAGTDALRVVISATDEANRRNIGRTIDESFEELDAIVALAGAAGRIVEVIFGMSFGCPLTGPVAPAHVERLVERAFAAGASEVVVADSYGFADPLSVEHLVGRLRTGSAGRPIGLHLHDTRGLGSANAFAALRAGVHSLDACMGGLGAGGLGGGHAASGNVATEDLVNLCEECGVQTGIDIARLSAATSRVRDVLGRPLPGRVHAVGTRQQLFAAIAAGAPPGASS